MSEIEIGIGKSARRGYGLDEVSIVPSRRTRDHEDVDIAWEIDAFRFELPLVAAAMDSVVSPATAIRIGALGGLAALNLEGLWARYEDPEPHLGEISTLPVDEGLARLQALYRQPVDTQLIAERIREIKDAGVTVCGAVRPQAAEALVPGILAAELDLLIIQGVVVSAEHVSTSGEPLNLKRFIRELPTPVLVGGCGSYQAALHLMRTGAAGVLVGVASGGTGTDGSVVGIGMPQATAVADAKGARMRHLDETGVYCHVIADGGMRTGGDIAKAIACGADAVMLGQPLAAANEAPGRGRHWGTAAAHATLPRGNPLDVEALGTLEEVLVGPAVDGTGRTNLFGGLRASMATTGHQTLKEFQKADLVVLSPAHGAP